MEVDGPCFRIQFVRQGIINFDPLAFSEFLLRAHNAEKYLE